MARVLAAVAAALVGLATLGAASLALAHSVPVELRPGQGPSVPRRTESRGPAQTAVRKPVGDLEASRDGVVVAGDEGWRRLAASGPGQMVPDLAGGLATALICLVAVVAALGLAAAPRRRQAVASLLTLTLAVLTFETGVHSVHHLGDDAGAARCSVAAASNHLAGTPEDGPALSAPVPAGAEPHSIEIPPVASAPFRCEATRGPPASPAA